MINIKDLYSLFQQANKIEEYQKILDLIDDSLRLRAEVAFLRKENEDLKVRMETYGDLDFKTNAYYKKSDNDGPFCQACWDKDKKLIRILPTNSYRNFYQCNICKNTVNLTGNYDPPLRMIPHREDYM